MDPHGLSAEQKSFPSFLIGGGIPTDLSCNSLVVEPPTPSKKGGEGDNSGFSLNFCAVVPSEGVLPSLCKADNLSVSFARSRNWLFQVCDLNSHNGSIPVQSRRKLLTLTQKMRPADQIDGPGGSFIGGGSHKPTDNV